MRALSIVLFCTVVFAQTPPSQSSVEASGSAVVYIQPDLVKIDIGVITQAATAEAAATRNAAKTQSTLDKLRASIPAKTQISTTGYSLSPDYQTQPGGKSTITGYTASNTVEVSTGDLAAAGKLIDAATAGGANQIQNLQFGLQDENRAEAQALHRAAVEARSNAAAMAHALGMSLGSVILVEQGAPEVVRPWRAFAAEPLALATPVKPGPIEVRATVTLKVALRPGTQGDM